MASYDAILIDFYGTVCAGDREAVDRACREIAATCRLAISAEELAIQWGERFFAVIAQSNHRRFKTLYECELSSLGQTFEALGICADPEPFVARLQAYWADPPVYADALEFLRRIEVPICCVSNADTKPLASAIQAQRLRFHVVVCSEQAKCYKPEAGIFQMALDRLAVSPSRVMHIGDSLHSDVAGAAGLGITTTWVCRKERIHDIGTARPDITIHSLAELPASLQ